MDDFDEIAAPTDEERRKGLFYLLGAVAFMLIPIIFGIVLANTGGEGDEESSGMADGASDTQVTTVATAPMRTNLSENATVLETSSDFNENFVGTNAIDGSIATEWSSRGDGDDAYIVIDLGAPQTITGIGFRTREMTDGTAITNTYLVTVDDGEPLGPFDAGVGLVVSDFTTTGQVIRIDLDTTTGGNTGAVEIEIYGS